jgi:hypothetical protein
VTKRVLAFLVFLPLALYGQDIGPSTGFNPKLAISGGAYTVATLPTGQKAGTLATVSDGTNSADCTAGSGSTLVTCQYTGSVWVHAAGGTGGGGLIQRCPFRAGYNAGPVLVNAQLRSQGDLCEIAAAATVKEIIVLADAGASTIRFCDLNGGVCTALSATITPASVSGLNVACVNAGGTAITIGGVSVTCGTLSATSLAIGDIIQTTADGTADGTSAVLFAQVNYTFN